MVISELEMAATGKSLVKTLKKSQSLWKQVFPEFVTWIYIEAKIPVALQWILAFFAF